MITEYDEVNFPIEGVRCYPECSSYLGAILDIPEEKCVCDATIHYTGDPL